MSYDVLQVADTQTVVFPACDCIDERRKKPLLHDPCEKVRTMYVCCTIYISVYCDRYVYTSYLLLQPAIVILKYIYTDEEASRRHREETTIDDKFEEITEEIRLWLTTTEGRNTLISQTVIFKNSIMDELTIRNQHLRKYDANTYAYIYYILVIIAVMCIFCFAVKCTRKDLWHLNWKKLKNE